MGKLRKAFCVTGVKLDASAAASEMLSAMVALHEEMLERCKFVILCDMRGTLSMFTCCEVGKVEEVSHEMQFLELDRA